jgi:predicted nucleic acid-binding Zn ribbon protein
VTGKSLQRLIVVVAAVPGRVDKFFSFAFKVVHLRLKQRDMNPSLRAAVISEWRRSPEKTARPDRWQAAGELLPKLMQKLGLKERLHETEVIEAWSKIVGDFIAAHSTPVALRDGILYVRVLQPALHYQFEQISKADILRKLKRRFGLKVIRDVRFRVG